MANEAPLMPGALQALQAQAQYGPLAGQAIQRSQYLADVLRQMQSSPSQPRSGASLGVQLLAQAITQYSKNKADREALDAYGKDRASLSQSALSGLPTDAAPSMPAPPPAPAAQVPAPAPAPPPPQAAPPPPMTPQPASAPDALARGLRNNNPLNVTTLPNGQQWNGQAGADGMYAKFASPQDGWNAADKNLTAYYLKHGLNNVSGVVNRWSPGAPPGYAQQVAAALKVDPNAPLDLSNPDLRHTMLSSMAGFENGQPVQFGQGAGPPPQQVPQQAPPMAPPIPQPAQPVSAPAPGGVPAGGAAPLSPPAGAAPAPIPHAMVAPEEVALARRLMLDPRTYDKGLAMALDLQARMAKPLAAPEKMMWGPDGKVHPIPGMETAQLPGQTPSDAAQRDAMGTITHTPIPGMQGPMPEGTVYSGGQIVHIQGGQPKPLTTPQERAAQGISPDDHGGYAMGPDGKVIATAKAPFDQSSLDTMRSSWASSDEYKKFAEAAAAYNGLTSALQHAVGKNNGILDTAAVDSYLRGINPGMGARNSTVSMFLSHQGWPAELKGAIQNALGDGYLTPETLQHMVGVVHDYAQAHRQIIADRSTSDLGVAQHYGYGPEQLGETLSPIADAPKLNFGPAAPAAPPVSADHQAAHAELQALYQAGKLTPAQIEKARKLGVIK